MEFRQMDEIVWAVNPKHDTLDSLATYLGGFGQDFLEAAGIRCRLDVPMQLPPWALTAELRHNVFLALKEALHNVVKHAGATEVEISLVLAPAGFNLIVSDNGRGFNPGRPEPKSSAPDEATRWAGGNGLLNMTKRLEESGGRCEWDASPGHGTRVRLTVPVKTGRETEARIAQ
jgi:signal transduction histidine kinase